MSRRTTVACMVIVLGLAYTRMVAEGKAPVAAVVSCALTLVLAVAIVVGLDWLLDRP